METLFILVNKTRLVLRTSSTLDKLKIGSIQITARGTQSFGYNHDDVTALNPYSTCTFDFHSLAGS